MGRILRRVLIGNNRPLKTDAVRFEAVEEDVYNVHQRDLEKVG